MDFDRCPSSGLRSIADLDVDIDGEAWKALEDLAQGGNLERTGRLASGEVEVSAEVESAQLGERELGDGAMAVRNKVARYPNTMIIGDATYQALMKHSKIQNRIKYAGISSVTSKVLAELTDIPNIHVGMSVYTTDGTTFTDVWGDNIVLAYVDQSDKGSRTEFNPSYGYTFQREGMPEIDTYYENGGKRSEEHTSELQSH